jgi:hypothetical protein
MVMAIIAVPGQQTPIAMVDVHLNSRNASGVAPTRSFIAYRAQVDALARFLRTNAPRGMPVIVAGDFNISDALRRAYLRARLGPWLGSAANNAFNQCLTTMSCRQQMPADAFRSLHHGRDWQFIRQGSSVRLIAQSIATPFGREPDGGMLSDHIGYMVSYRLAPVP